MIFALRKSTKLSFLARPQTRNSLRPKAAHENQPADWFSNFPLPFDSRPVGKTRVNPLLRGTENQGMDNLRFTSIAKKYSTGIFFTVRSKIAYRRSPRARTPAAYFKARSRPFGNPSSRSPFMTWPNKSATALRENTPPGYFLIPQGSRLCWHCAVHTYFMEQLRAEYRFSAVRALSAAVRPAFSVPICAPG